MVATAAIPAGAEVVNSYGRLSNSDLLRGYGYVEAVNPNEHAQLPAQFLIRAAAALRGGERDAGAGGGGGDDDDDDDDDGEVYDVEDSEEESSEASEADYEFEDDGDDGAAAAAAAAEAAAAAAAEAAEAAAAAAPKLAEATELISDWEDRWSLAHALKLLPKSGAFSVFEDGGSGGAEGGVPPGEMAAVTALLLAEVSQCRRLLHIVQRAGKGEQPEPNDGAEAAAAAAGPSIAAAGVADLKLPPGGAVRETLQVAARLMLSRYPTSLADDEKRLAEGVDKLPPRLQAALIARAGEKRCLHALLHVLESINDAALSAAARGAIAAGATALEQRRLAARAARAAAEEEDEREDEGGSSEDDEGDEEEEGEDGSRSGDDEVDEVEDGEEEAQAAGKQGGKRTAAAEQPEKRPSKRQQNGCGAGTKEARQKPDASAKDKSFSFGFNL